MKEDVENKSKKIKANLMVVDDTPHNLRLLVGMLTEQGYKVRPVPSGALALSAVKASPPDLMLLDINMPEINGYEVCRQLKADEDTRNIPVIFLSALDETLDKVKAFQAGGVDYITKPFQIEEVLARISTHLNLRRLQREMEEMNITLEERVKERTEELLQVSLEKERIESDLRIAADIQNSMLPRTFPPFPDRNEIDIFASMEPAKQVGGDFYDYFFIDQNHLFFCIGDVAGKGVPAALFMAIVKTLIKDKTLNALPPNDILYEVNKSLCPDNDSGMFATVFCGILNTDNGEIRYSCAGHNPPLVRHESNDFEFLELVPGVAVGPMPFERGVYQLRESVLMPNDILFLYSDGVTEAIDQEERFFTSDRLVEKINQASLSDAASVVSLVHRELGIFCGSAPQADDITMLAIKYRGNNS